MRWLAIIIVVGTYGFATETAEAQQDSNRLLAYLGLGAGGEVTVDPDVGGQFDVDLDTSVGLGVRYELMLGDLVSIAPMFEWLTYELDDGFSDREHIIDLDVFLKFRGTVRAGTTDIEIYGGVPIGFSVATREDDDALLGFNLGVLAGVAAFFGKFGVFFEVGWRGHQLWRDDVRYGANQAGINIGGAIQL